MVAEEKLPSRNNLSFESDVTTVNVNGKAGAEKNEDPSIAWKLDHERNYNNGPDQILPSEAIYTWRADGATKLKLWGGGDKATSTPISVPTLLEAAVQRAPTRMAIAIKRNDVWQKWTYSEYLRDVRNAAKGFIALGLEPYHSVCIMGYNAPEWLISDLAVIHAGGFASGIYTTNSPEACAFIVKNSKAQIVVVEDSEQLSKILSHKKEFTHLKAIIQYTGQPDVANVYSWDEFMLLGKQQTDDILNQRLKGIAVNQCCTLVHTSGTTGDPKGVMISHDSHTWTTKVSCSNLNFRDCCEEYISFLPLSNLGGQFFDIYCALTCCASIYIADRNALKDSLFETIKEIRPTILFGLPRIWEKLHDKMQDVLTDEEKANKLSLAHSKIMNALGLDRSHVYITGGAPTRPEIREDFRSLGIEMIELYGMSESGPVCMGGQNGFTIDPIITKLDKVDEDGNGEICMGGRGMAMGYFNQPEKTIEAIDLDGWLHSGDIGKINEDGLMTITGRIKELVITAGGKNIAPVPIENNVKAALPVVSQAMVVGDKVKHLSILLTLKTEVEKGTMKPLDTLHPFVKDWINTNGECDVNTVQDVLKELYEKQNSKLAAAFMDGINQANTKAESNAHKVQKWHLLPVDFSYTGGELGPTLKLRRPIVLQKYQHIIGKLY